MGLAHRARADTIIAQPHRLAAPRSARYSRRRIRDAKTRVPMFPEMASTLLHPTRRRHGRARTMRLMRPGVATAVALLGLLHSPIIAAPAADEPLELVATIGGQSTSDLRIKDERIVPHFDGSPVRDHTSIAWSLRGDIFADPRLAQCSPIYFARRKAAPNGEAGSAGVVIDVNWYLSRNSWPLSVMSRDGAIVGAWVHRGRPIHIQVLYLPPILGSIHGSPRGPNIGGMSWAVGPEEAAGFPAILIWENRHWVRQPPYSHNPAFLAAVTALNRSDAQAFADAISKLKDIDTRPGRADATLLHLASERGADFAVQALIDRGARLDVTTDWSKSGFRALSSSTLHETPLDWAVRTGRTSVAKLLMRHGAASQLDEATLHKSFDAALEGGWTEIAWDLLHAMPESRSHSRRLGEVLDAALRLGNTAQLETWLASLGPNALADTPPEVVIQAATTTDASRLRLLLRWGASPDAAAAGTTALTAAAAANRAEAIDSLVAAGADVDLPAADGTTPLHAAARTSALEAAKRLLRAGADPNIPDSKGATALHAAAQSGRADLVEILLSGGARTDIADSQARTPLELALDSRISEGLAAMERYGARLDPRSPHFTAALSQCLASDQLTLIERACEDGWSPDTPLPDQWMAWQVAALSGADATATWLRARTSATVSRRVIRISDAVTPPRAVTVALGREARHFHPPYLAAGVVVEGVVTEDGSLEFARVVQTPNPVMTQHVLRAIGSWKFTPARQDDRAVAVQVRIKVSFAPDPKRSAGPHLLSATFENVPTD